MLYDSQFEYDCQQQVGLEERAAARKSVNAFYNYHFGHPYAPTLTVPGLNPMEFIGFRGLLEKSVTENELIYTLSCTNEAVRNMAGNVVAKELLRFA